MLIRDLLAELLNAQLIGPADADLRAVCYDSRDASPGSIFVAIPGFKVDGHDYIGQALHAGASAIVVQADHEPKWRAPLAEVAVALIVVPDTRVALAQIAAALNGHPARELHTVGITGTDGKTSLAHLVAHLFNATGRKAGLISTAECRIGDQALPDIGRFTTPEAPEVQSMLAQMIAANCGWAVIEATSHGLALHRVDQCEYDIAAFTNLGADHLDFHGGAEDYRHAKGRLFQMLDESASKDIQKTAVLNVDDPAHAYFRTLTRAAVTTYGVHGPADLTAADVQFEGWACRFVLHAGRSIADARLPRPGAFNVSNALAATAIGLAAGLDLPTIVPALESWTGAPGRMQLIDEGQPFRVVVDFAHAPDSLQRVLQLLRQLSRGRIIAVFGCIGERDKDRRAAMGRVAAQHADYTIVTDDNPYTEDRDAIIEEIAAGLRASGKKEGHDFAVVPDRRDAIAQAVAMAVDEDAVLLAGKGHEREVHLANSSYDCDDREVAMRVLRELGHGR